MKTSLQVTIRLSLCPETRSILLSFKKHLPSITPDHH